MNVFRKVLGSKTTLHIPRGIQVRPSSKVEEALCICEAEQLDNPTVMLNTKERLEIARHKGNLSICGQITQITPVTGIPIEHVTGRRVRIYEEAKNAMQSGSNNVYGWTLEFDTRARWENPLMGWASSGDPMGNMKLKFSSERDAIAFCEKYGYPWFLDHRPRYIGQALRPGSYASNYSWDKRCRTSTK